MKPLFNATFAAVVAIIAGCGFSSPTPAPVVAKTVGRPLQEPSAAVAPIQALPPQELVADLHDLPESDARSNAIGKPARLLFQDDFSDLVACQNSLVDGKTTMAPMATRLFLPFAAYGFKGRFVLHASECPDVLGEDARPGVLSVEWKHVPEAVDYSGFRYQGRVDKTGRLQLPQVLAAKTADDLRGIKFRAKFKSLNEDAGDSASVKFDLRIEPLEDRKYDNRIDFGTVKATPQWKVFEMDLANATNVQKFLEASSLHRSGLYVLILAQTGSIDDYHDGDGLLIDDIEIVDLRSDDDSLRVPPLSNPN
jgi:hypothetical protein